MEEMECMLSGNQIKSLNRAVNCLYRVGSELLIEVLPDKLSLRTLNSAWSAFLSVSFKGQFFDAFHVHTPAACSVLLKELGKHTGSPVIITLKCKMCWWRGTRSLATWSLNPETSADFWVIFNLLSTRLR